MKREEMVDKIYNELMHWTDEHTKYATTVSPVKRELADLILKSIEEAGMLPPKWIPEDIGYVHSDRPFEEPNGFEIGVHKWEPTND